MENKDYKIINVHYFNPAAKDVRERLEITYCCNSENCNLYKQNKCVQNKRYFANVCCPHGKYSSKEGYTKRAKSFYDMKTKAEEQYKGLMDCIEFTDEKLALVGDYIFLPYPHLKNYVNSLDGIIKEQFIKLEDFNSKMILKILNFKPQALMGGEIKEFQTKEVPRFISHLKEEFPDKWNEFCKEYPQESGKYVKDINYVGRVAYINTLSKNSEIIDCHNRKFIFDGEYIVSDNWDSPFIPFNGKSAIIKVKPDDKMTIKITNNNQVCKTTIFKN